MDKHLNKVDRRTSKIDQHFDMIDKRFDKMEEQFEFMRILIENITKEVHTYFETCAPFASRIKPQIIKLKVRIEHVEMRTYVLEYITKSHAAKLNLQ